MIVVVTIVMPVYHPGKYLKSLLTQTLGDFRLIAIDDGSMDGSFFACARFIWKKRILRDALMDR